jgi:hypothetical protein
MSSSRFGPSPARLFPGAVFACLLATLLVPPALAAPPVRGDADPLPDLVRRIERYLRRNEVDGVTMDWRYEVSPSEEIRQTVVCQVLAYAEIQRLKPSGRVRKDLVEHADFMLGRLADIRSHSPFDGMLAYALWSAFETTGEDRFRAAALEVSAEMRAIPTEFCVLNGGLMVAMGTAKEWQLTGNAEAREKTRDIVAGLLPYHNEDGSFPHWCHGSRDIHYTGWMAMELIHIARLVDDPLIPPMLERMTAFLEERVGPDGRSSYEAPCPWSPTDCTIHYYSRASGCSIDYDTRGWTVEPAYTALVFDHARSPEYGPVIRFLDSLEEGGTLADLYGWWPPPSDPEYPWTIADTSVVNMSVIFWALTTALTERERRGDVVDLRLDETVEPAAFSDPPPGERPLEGLVVGPNPVRGACLFRFALGRPGPASLDVFDARGRRVRTLARGDREAGAHAVTWDGRDDAGRPVAGGLYFARLAAPGLAAERRLVVAR